MSHTDNTPTVPKTIRLIDADDDEVVTDPGTGPGPSVGDADDQEGSVNGDDDDADDNEDAGEEDEDEDAGEGGE